MSAPELSTRADDGILPGTRWVAIFIIPFLVAAVILLFGFPTRTGELFAWPIAPSLSAYLLASAYLGGIWFFVRVATARRWHHVRHGYPAVVVFAAALLVATLLHLDRFSMNLSFIVWFTLYATTPFVIAVVAIVQRPRDPGTADTPDVLIPGFMRVGLAVTGACAFVTGAVMFVAPQAATAFWAWQVTPLTAQALGAVLSLTGVVNAALLWDARWSAFRILFQAQLLSLAAIVLSLVGGHAELLWDRPMTPVFIGLVTAGVVVYGWLTLWCELRLRSAKVHEP
ncbi:hypothetical protein [Microbacterium deminutum]|uniref:Uncharacterized protein n=1 Tax=Microbacterium deminutum TaxID=344164 RepID=A0ABP5BG39_9MICO